MRRVDAAPEHWHDNAAPRVLVAEASRADVGKFIMQLTQQMADVAIREAMVVTCLPWAIPL